MNGNDIVDLKTSVILNGVRRSRFMDKIFSPCEKEIINNGGVGVWTMWAVKEAVYKAHHRRFHLSRIFEPKSIQVKIREASAKFILAEVEYMKSNYLAKGFITSDYVHVSATALPGKTLYQEIYKVSPINIKDIFKKVISEKLGLEMKYLEILKDKNQIPYLMYKNVILHLPFSISHHGEFGAFSFQLINY